MSKNLVHIKGVASKIHLSDELSNNYDIPSDFGTDENCFEETMNIIPNVTVKIYSSDTEKPIEEIQENHIRQILGDVSLIGILDGYSEYTITGFDIDSCFIGGHNLQNIINSFDNKYLHITIEWED